MESKVTLQKTQTAVFASLKDITVFNPAVDAIHPKVTILIYSIRKEQELDATGQMAR